MISSDVLRGYNDTMILSILIERDSYGYEISKEIEKRSHGTYSMKETTLYSVFNRLEKNGYISSYYGTETMGKRRTYYRISDIGRDYYKEKCEEWSATKQLINYFVKEDTNGDD